MYVLYDDNTTKSYLPVHYLFEIYSKMKGMKIEHPDRNKL